MGRYWDELGKVKGANLEQFSADQGRLGDAISVLSISQDLLRQLESRELFGGQTDSSIAEVARGLSAHLEELGGAARELGRADAQVQGAIEAAQKNYDDLPQSTEPSDFELFIGSNSLVQVGNYIMTGEEFLTSVTASREAERERQAKDVLDVLNASFSQHQELLSKIHVQPIEFAFIDNGDEVAVPQPPVGSEPVVPPNTSIPPGESSGGPVPPSGIAPVGGPAPVGSLPPGGVSPDADGDGVPDGVSLPDVVPGIPPAQDWPFRVYRPGDVSRDGPVDGGYSVPLNPRDGALPRDPVWREMFAEHQRQAQARAGSGLGGLATAAGVAGLAAAGGRAGLGAAGTGARSVNLPGGAAGVGGPGAAGGRGVGVGGLGRGSGVGLPGGAGARGVGAGGVTPDGVGRGAGAGGAAGLRGAGAGGVGGGGLGSGAAGAGSAAGAGGARGMGGVPMGGAMGGPGGSEEKERSRRRRKYGKSGVEFFSMSDPVNPGAAAGEGGVADARLIDAPQRDEGDRW